MYQDLDAYFEDFDRISDLIYGETGLRPTQFRFPGGSSNTVSYQYGGEDLVRRIALEAKRRGLTYHDWNVSSGDAGGHKQTVEEVLGNVVGPAMKFKEPVVLMHDVVKNAATRDALPQIIEQLSAAGYNFDTMANRSAPCQHRHWEEEPAQTQPTETRPSACSSTDRRTTETHTATTRPTGTQSAA